MYDSSLDLVQSRKWQVTINNPLDKGWSHDAIQQVMSCVRGASLYWCMCDEQGDECETLHTHIFIFRKSPFTARQIDNLFPKMHREKCYGTTQENRAYILKDGEKFGKDDTGHYSYTDSTGKHHDGVNFSDTFWESGECPQEHQGTNNNSELIVEMIQNGATNQQIVQAIPAAYKDLDKLDRTRGMFRDSDYSKKWRDLTVTYIFGKTGSGKIRSVMDKFGYENCYRVTDYKHPFDTYDGQDVIIFEEFRGGLRHGDMLNYLDGYPLLLPCRYFNRQACFTKVFIITNIPPEEQYLNVDKESRWAFFRRIHKVIQYSAGGVQSWDSFNAYLKRNAWTDTADTLPTVDILDWGQEKL